MKGRLAAAVLGVVIVVGGVSCSAIKTRVWMNEGNKLYKAQRYDEAVEYYKKIVAIDPNNWTANYLIAMSYTALYHPGSEHEKDKEYVTNAIKTFEKLMTMQAPDKDTEERVRNYYVALLLAANMTDKVKTYYIGLLAKNPRDTKLMGQLAEIYAKDGDFENSLKYYQKRTEAEPTTRRSGTPSASRAGTAFTTSGLRCRTKRTSRPSTPESPRSRRRSTWTSSTSTRSSTSISSTARRLSSSPRPARPSRRERRSTRPRSTRRSRRTSARSAWRPRPPPTR